MLPTKNSNLSECSNISSNCVIWQGPDIACIDICTGDNISVVVAKLAEQLCAILDGVDPDLSGLDLACVLPEGELAPTSLSDTFQLIIDYICSIQPGSQFSLPVVSLPECLYYTDPETEELITSLILDDYAELIANKICDILDSIAIINSTLSDHETRLITLENCVLPCTNEVGEVNVVSSCIIEGELVPLSQLVLALEIRFCDLESAVGSPALIANALNNACIVGTDAMLSNNGTYSSLSTWVNSPTTLAETVNNLWAVVCDMHTAIEDIQLNCCPGVCNSIVFDYAVTPVLDGVGTLVSFDLLFSNSSIPSGFTDCGGSTTVVLTDSNNLQANQIFNFSTYSGTANTLNVPVGSLNIYDDITVSIDFCVTNETDQCTEEISKVIPLTPGCPTDIRVSGIASTAATVTFSNYLGSTATYLIEIINVSTGLVESSVNLSSPGVVISETFTGLNPGVDYTVRVTISINGAKTVCNLFPFSTITTPADPPCDSGIDIGIVLDYTSSMSSVIADVKSGIANLISTVDTVSQNNYRFGLALVDETSNEGSVSYSANSIYTSLPSSQKYVNTGTTPNSDIYVTAMEMFSLNNDTSFTTQINSLAGALPIGSGNYPAEPMDVALSLVVNDQFLGAFRSNIAKYIILITDANPSGSDDSYNSPSENDTAAINLLSTQCQNEGVKVIVLGAGANNIDYQMLATDTGGSWNVSFNADTIASEISNLCG